MPLIPFATFLAGALLTILLPIIMLILLIVWYDVLIRRHGEPADTSDLGRSGAEASGAGSPASAPGGGVGPGSQSPGSD